MARKRQARRCTARRTNGQPCKAYAILGGEVCTAHGGSSWRVKVNALVRHWEPIVGGAYDRAYQRWRREVFDWHVRRILGAASILGTDPANVTEGDLLWLAIDGQIPSETTTPKIRVDRRYGPRTRAQLATRAARQAARKAAGDKSSAETPPGPRGSRRASQREQRISGTMEGIARTLPWGAHAREEEEGVVRCRSRRR